MHMTDDRSNRYNIPLKQESKSTISQIENVTHVPTGWAKH